MSTICEVCLKLYETRELEYVVNHYGLTEIIHVCEMEDDNGNPTLRLCWNCGEWSHSDYCEC